MIRRVFGLSTVAALVAVGTGCFGGANENNWREKSATVSCSMAKRCSTSQFYFHYDSMSDCVDEAQDLYDDQADFLENSCEFDKKQARKCIRLMKRSCKKIGGEYDDLYDVCSQVWSCSSEMPVDTGTTGGGGGGGTMPTLPLGG